MDSSTCCSPMTVHYPLDNRQKDYSVYSNSSITSSSPYKSQSHKESNHFVHSSKYSSRNQSQPLYPTHSSLHSHPSHFSHSSQPLHSSLPHNESHPPHSTHPPHSHSQPSHNSYSSRPSYPPSQYLPPSNSSQSLSHNPRYNSHEQAYPHSQINSSLPPQASHHHSSRNTSPPSYHTLPPPPPIYPNGMPSLREGDLDFSENVFEDEEKFLCRRDQEDFKINFKIEHPSEPSPPVYISHSASMNKTLPSSEFIRAPPLSSPKLSPTTTHLPLVKIEQNLLKELTKKSDFVVKTEKKKKKNPNYVPVNPFPVIIKKDFRRFFVQMLVNVMNSHDFKLVQSFFNNFFDKNAIFFNSINLTSPIACHKASDSAVFFCNVNTFVLFYLFQTAKSPDETFRFEDVKIIQYKDEERLMVSFIGEVNMTQLYETSNYPHEVSQGFLEISNRDEIIANLVQQFTQGGRESMDSELLTKCSHAVKERVTSLYDKLSRNDYDPINLFQLDMLKNPLKFNLKLRLRYVFDSNKRVIASFSDQISCNNDY